MDFIQIHIILRELRVSSVTAPHLQNCNVSLSTNHDVF